MYLQTWLFLCFLNSGRTLGKSTFDMNCVVCFDFTKLFFQNRNGSLHGSRHTFSTFRTRWHESQDFQWRNLGSEFWRRVQCVYFTKWRPKSIENLQHFSSKFLPTKQPLFSHKNTCSRSSASLQKWQLFHLKSDLCVSSWPESKFESIVCWPKVRNKKKMWKIHVSKANFLCMIDVSHIVEIREFWCNF